MTPDGLAALRVLTLNHHNLGVQALADRALSQEGLAALRAALASAAIEAMVLATCNRTEVYWRSTAADEDARACGVVAAHLAGPVADHHGRLSGAAAATHLFRVCAGLESLVLGEAEILGQVRSALDASPAAGRFLQRVVQAGLRAGGLARAETGIGVGAQSVASAAVQVLASALRLAEARVAVVGAGATGVKTARHLRARGVARLVLVNRSLDRAVHAAAAVHAEVCPLDQLAAELADADAVVCAVAAPRPVIDRHGLQTAVARRGGRPLTIVDLSMPPVVEHGSVDGVTRVDLADLERHVDAHRGRRTAEIPKVEAIITRELGHLYRWAGRQGAPRPLEAC